MYSRDHPVALPQLWAGGYLDLIHKWGLETLWALVELPPSGSLLIFEKQNTWFINRSDVPINQANLSVPLSEYIYICASSIYLSRKRSNTHLARFSVAQRLFCKKNGLLSDIAQIDLFFLHSLVFTFLKCNVFVSYIYESILNFKKWGWVMRTNLNLTKAFQGRGWRLWITFLNTWSNFLYPDIWIQSCGRWC